MHLQKIQKVKKIKINKNVKLGMSKYLTRVVQYNVVDTNHYDI